MPHTNGRARGKLRLTREGRWFVGIAAALAVVALNTGNNLFYLLVALMAAMLAASLLLSQVALAGLEVLRTPPPRAHAKQAFLVGLALKNRKRRLPSFSIEISDLINGQPLDKKCYFLKLPAGRSQATAYRYTLPRRGRAQFTSLLLSTKFPFALLRRTRSVPLAGEFIVYPELIPIARGRSVRPKALGDLESLALSRRGEPAGLRDLRDGDDPRDVHWASSARRGRPLVREFEEESSRRVVIFVDNGLPELPSADDLDGCERAISLAASLGVEYLLRGYSLYLVARGDGLPAAWLRGRPQIVPLLRALALLPTVASDLPFSARPDAAQRPILVVPRGRRGDFGRVIEA